MQVASMNKSRNGTFVPRTIADHEYLRNIMENIKTVGKYLTKI